VHGFGELLLPKRSTTPVAPNSSWSHLPIAEVSPSSRMGPKSSLGRHLSSFLTFGDGDTYRRHIAQRVVTVHYASTTAIASRRSELVVSSSNVVCSYPSSPRPSRWDSRQPRPYSSGSFVVQRWRPRNTSTKTSTPRASSPLWQIYPAHYNLPIPAGRSSPRTNPLYLPSPLKPELSGPPRRAHVPLPVS
jgi:hypothetical protein